MCLYKCVTMCKTGKFSHNGFVNDYINSTFNRQREVAITLLYYSNLHNTLVANKNYFTLQPCSLFLDKVVRQQFQH